ncbi:uncharacterized protein EKO05_0005142 [Ascochyta rabiei]|uniref:Uncharacterized protein n=1 Tax=Didymella rabiei TaxID=5454 RepID=A0A162V8S2_DIDRA|nr:uncharacterized protein EKO05_0005142 [Ascochyta rabiei]KZM18292.1 hypothetical protein ST47_g10572 [Ascochyta rabiei]UPX14667.1 hypothetical protein EKO05_0005142 [Ascochyta rabiei]
MSAPNTHLSAKDAHLYGAKNTARSKRREISSSSTVAFSSTLAHLIKASSSTADGSTPSTAGRARPRKDDIKTHKDDIFKTHNKNDIFKTHNKNDIFKTHNKNVKKRALADLADADLATQKHRGRTGAEKEADEASWKRTQRRMEEKARLYAALKRGDVEDTDDRYGVDFDRKWADTEAAAAAGNASSSSSSDGGDSADEEHVEYVDEFGRTRKGTRADALREERRKRTLAHDVPDRFTARPSMPDHVIYGDTVQTNAFNPDETIAQQMADLAAKRDKELTPPPDLHFDGRAEARSRGTGFMYFDQDEEERQKQMANLDKERAETERVRKERKEAIDKRKEMIKEKKRLMAEKRSKGKAEKFLDALGVELAMGGEGDEADKQRVVVEEEAEKSHEA